MTLVFIIVFYLTYFSKGKVNLSAEHFTGCVQSILAALDFQEFLHEARFLQLKGVRDKNSKREAIYLRRWPDALSCSD